MNKKINNLIGIIKTVAILSSGIFFAGCAVQPSYFKLPNGKTVEGECFPPAGCLDDHSQLKTNEWKADERSYMPVIVTYAGPKKSDMKYLNAVNRLRNNTENNNPFIMEVQPVETGIPSYLLEIIDGENFPAKLLCEHVTEGDTISIPTLRRKNKGGTGFPYQYTHQILAGPTEVYRADEIRSRRIRKFN